MDVVEEGDGICVINGDTCMGDYVCVSSLFFPSFFPFNIPLSMTPEL